MRLTTANSVLLLGGSLFAFSVAFPPFNDAAAINPSIHMVEHVLILVSGALVAYSLIQTGALPTARSRLGKALGVLGVSSILVFWHSPGPWDAAVLNPVVHFTEHGSLFAAGMLVSVCLLGLSDVAKVMMLVLGVIAHTAYALLLTSSYLVYSVYTLPQQNSYGLFVFAMDPLFLGLIVWVIWRAEASPLTGRAPSVLKLSSAAVAVLLVSVMLGFYVQSAVAIAQAPASLGDGPVVVIQETPISWQYSPQNLTVVIGFNNTVTWISRSLGYDTVTGQNGTFSSGQLAPGETYTYVFSSPGRYPYHCIYHPWMVGVVTVLPAPAASAP